MSYSSRPDSRSVLRAGLAPHGQTSSISGDRTRELAARHERRLGRYHHPGPMRVHRREVKTQYRDAECEHRVEFGVRGPGTARRGAPLRRLAGSFKVPGEVGTPGTRSSRKETLDRQQSMSARRRPCQASRRKKLPDDHACETSIESRVTCMDESVLRPSQSRNHAIIDGASADGQPRSEPPRHAACRASAIRAERRREGAA